MNNIKFFKEINFAKSGIHINPKNKGKFTETMQRTGKSAEELSHSKNPLTRKRAQFAINAKQWKHKNGGLINKAADGEAILYETEETPTSTWQTPNYGLTSSYVISDPWQQQIKKWEGSTMKTNHSFSHESKKALAGIYPEVLQMLSPEQVDSLISYSYHIPGKYARDVVKTVNGLQGIQNQNDYKAVMQNIKKSMEVKSTAARGTRNRVAKEQAAFYLLGGHFQGIATDNGLVTHDDKGKMNKSKPKIKLVKKNTKHNMDLIEEYK